IHRSYLYPVLFDLNRSVDAFLTHSIYNAHTSAANLLDDLVVAELHLDSARLLAVEIVLKRPQSSLEQTDAAKSAWRIGKYRRPAFCTHALNFVSVGTQSRSSLLCTDRNFVKGYVWTTAITRQTRPRSTFGDNLDTNFTNLHQCPAVNSGPHESW